MTLQQFFKTFSSASKKLLLLDYDGTLAPFHSDPDQAVPYHGVRELLTKIQALDDTRMVIISGRWTRDLVPLLGLKQQPEIWGSHGIERLKPDGEYETIPMDEHALKGMTYADELISEYQMDPYTEQKPGCLALHWRGFRDSKISYMKDWAQDKLGKIASEHSLKLATFDGGVELRVPGRSKGDAVNILLEESGPDVSAAFLGDDLTDEDAFEAIKGRGLGILVRPEYRETAADIHLEPPEELIEFFENWINQSHGEKQ